MKLVLADAVSFKKSVDAISVLIDEAQFTVGSEGVFLRATDPSQISMIDFLLPKAAFKHFECPEQKKLGLDMDYLSQVMSRAKNDDSLELSIDETGSKLLVVFSGKSRRKFEVPLIDVSASELPSPKIEFDVELKISANVLQDGLKDAALISTHIALGIDSDSFFLEAHSSKGSMKNEVKANQKEYIKEFNAKKEARSVFPLDYLSDIVKAAPSDKELSLKLKSNAPILVSYTIGEAFIRYFLAPRIEGE